MVTTTHIYDNPRRTGMTLLFAPLVEGYRKLE